MTHGDAFPMPVHNQKVCSRLGSQRGVRRGSAIAVKVDAIATAVNDLHASRAGRSLGHLRSVTDQPLASLISLWRVCADVT